MLAEAVGGSTVSIDTGSYFAGSSSFYPAFAGTASAQAFANANYSAYGLTYRDFAAGGASGLSNYLQLVAQYSPLAPKATVTKYGPNRREPPQRLHQ